MRTTLMLSLLLLGCGEGDPAAEILEIEAGEAPVGVRINGRGLTSADLEDLEARLYANVPPGNYWYDARSGLGGPWGAYASIYLPGLDFGPVPAEASGGTTDIFYNGRELTLAEARLVAWLFGIPEAAIPQFRGRYVLESNGDLYSEAGQYLGNLAALAAERWPSGTGNGGCTAVRIPSSAPNPTGVPQTIDVATGTDC